jgi:hypothetical protein
MSIPDKKLVITGEDGKPFEFGELFIDESALFEQGGFNRRGAMKFLEDHSNWKSAEIKRIKEKELMDVWKQIIDKVNDATVPLVK